MSKIDLLAQLNSISRVSRQFETYGSSPILVLASDKNEYVCKYHRSANPSFSGNLINEYLASEFLKCWNIYAPVSGFIKFKVEHIEGLGLQHSWFDIPCFGSCYDSYANEIDALTSTSNSLVRKGMQKKDTFLKIALFDIWLSNEDRNLGNYNLLLDTINQNIIFPIDHEKIFNSNSLRQRKICSITYEDSLISSPFTSTLYSKKKLANKGFLDELKKYFYICINNCEAKLPTIIESIPNEWCNDKSNLEKLLTDNIFQDNWKDQCFQLFLEFIQTNINQ